MLVPLTFGIFFLVVAVSVLTRFWPRKPVSFAGKRILLCGASTGIGRELALEYASSGAHLVLASRTASVLEKVAEDCRAAGAASATVHAVDLSSIEGCKQLVITAVKTMGGVDVLVLNHIRPFFGAFDTTPLEEIHSVISVNFLSYVTLTHLSLPHLLASRGNIVAISSVAGKMGTPFVVPYSAAKHAIHGLFDALRLELDLTHPGHGVGITTCVLGNIDTVSAKEVTRGHLQNLPRESPVDTARVIAQAGGRRDRELYFPFLQTTPGLLLYFFFPVLIGAAVKRAVGAPQHKKE
eukprot:m.237817 g.237817  ORF g.237817 m.237817 type:complete len:295 (+) comp21412_c0_seq1:223-1107(+)